MFKIYNNGFRIAETNDTHDLYDIFLGLTGDEDVSKEAWVSASNMGFGDKKEIGGYLIEQFDETFDKWKKFGTDELKELLRSLKYCSNENDHTYLFIKEIEYVLDRRENIIDDCFVI